MLKCVRAASDVTELDDVKKIAMSNKDPELSQDLKTK
jgi:hypothetical protein